MIHEYLIKAVMSVVHVSDNPHATASRCSVSNRKILDIATKVESLKKNRTLLWYNLTTKNIYLDGSEIISTLNWFKAKHTKNGSFVKHVK